MALFKSLLSPTKTGRPRPPNALESSVLSNLPPELIIYIARFLPAMSAAFLSLCCKSLHDILATPYLKCRHGHHPFNSFDFLQLLEQDLPDHVTCYYCKKFHAIKYAKRHRDPYKRCDGGYAVEGSITRFTSENFRYVVFQMAMKRHRQGADCSALLRSFSSEIAVYLSKDIYHWKDRKVFRAVQGSCLFRAQIIFVVHPSKDSRFQQGGGHPICPHLWEIRGTKVLFGTGGETHYGLQYGQHPKIAKIYTDTKQHDCCNDGNVNEGHFESVLAQCDFCRTEFKVDRVQVGKQGQAFFITVWKDLGEGKTPQDPIWRAHMDYGGRPTKVNFQPGSIRDAFQGSEVFNFNSLLTPRERKKLFKVFS